MRIWLLIRRTATALILAALLCGGVVVGFSWLEAPARSVGLDVWNVPAQLREVATSDHVVGESRRESEELEAIAERREAILRDVLDARLTVQDGLVRLQSVYDESAVLQQRLRVFYHTLEPGQVLRAHYREHLEDAMRRHPMGVAWVRPQFEELFPPMCKPMTSNDT
jgi:hypothetical protein